MPSQKKIKSICHNLAHHAASGLSFLSPHLQQTCRASGLHSVDIDLLQAQPYPAALKPLKSLEYGLVALRKRFETILAAEGFAIDDFGVMLLRFDFSGATDDYGSNCHAFMVSKQGTEARESVNSIGENILHDASLGKNK